MNPENEKKVIVAEVPLAELHKYATDLRSMTQGRGSFEYYFERYEEAPMEMQKKIAQLNLLARQESQLLKKLANAKETYYAGVLDQVYKSTKRGK